MSEAVEQAVAWYVDVAVAWLVIMLVVVAFGSLVAALNALADWLEGMGRR